MTGTARKATVADIPRLMQIRMAVKENILSDPTKVTADDCRWFVENAPFWVWDDAGTIKGFSAGDPRNGTIWALFIDPVYERQGIGRIVFAHVCEELHAAGHSTLSLTTDEGTRAAAFYRAAGWQSDGTLAKGELTFRKTFGPQPS